MANVLVADRNYLSNDSADRVRVKIHPTTSFIYKEFVLFCSSHLQDEQEEEVCVGYFLELLKQVDRQKGDDVVLGRHDAVILEEDEGEIKLRRFTCSLICNHQESKLTAY